MLLFSSCGEYNFVLKTNDPEVKYSYAKKYYNKKKYSKSISLLEDVVFYFRGRAEGEEALYLLAQSHYGVKNYEAASEYYKSYFTTFPKGEFAELARFTAAYGLYLDSPDPRLDQNKTYESISQFLMYLEYYPQSDKAKQAQDILFELQEKLAHKEYLGAKLYYNLGTYMGDNYTSCIITAENALKSYPDTKYREELVYLVICSKFELAIVSIDERLQGRYRDVVDHYYNYMNEFPEGKYAKQISKYFEFANSKIERNY